MRVETNKIQLNILFFFFFAFYAGFDFCFLCKKKFYFFSSFFKWKCKDMFVQISSLFPIFSLDLNAGKRTKKNILTLL